MKTSSISPKNHCSHLLESLRSQWIPYSIKENHHMMGKTLVTLEKLLTIAHKFYIEDGDELLLGSIPNEKEIVNFHLPFPVVALEYELEKIQKIDEKRPLPSPRRISLIIEIDSLNNSKELFPDNIVKEGGWAVVPCWMDDMTKQWIVCHTVAIIPRYQEGKEKNYTVYERDELNKIKVDMNIDLEPLLPEYIDLMINRAGIDYYWEVRYLDTIDEVVSALTFLMISNCKNISTKLVSKASEKLNKKRTNKAKPPLFDYYSLVVSRDTVKYIYTEQTNEEKRPRSSPRFHFRKGHPRRLPTGRNIWIPPTTVGNIEKGFIGKDYILFKK